MFYYCIAASQQIFMPQCITLQKLQICYKLVMKYPLSLKHVSARGEWDFLFLPMIDMWNHRHAHIHCFLYWKVSQCHKRDEYWSQLHCKSKSQQHHVCRVTLPRALECVWQSQITCTLTAWIIYWAPDVGRIPLNISSLRNVLSWMNFEVQNTLKSSRTSMF